MIDPQLMKIRDLCIQRYMRIQSGLILRWSLAKLRGELSDATVAPFNVHGVGIARKRKNGRKLDTICIQIAVLRKMDESDVARHGGTVIEPLIEGIPIDVVESGPLVMEEQSDQVGEAAALTRVRPLRPGCSISHGNAVFGTLGGLCRSTRAAEQGKTFALSCRHVLVGFLEPPFKLEIFQPGGTQAAAQGIQRIAAKCSRCIESPNPNAQPPGYSADAAIAELDPGVEFDVDYLGIGPRHGLIDLVDPDEDERSLLQDLEFEKFGRTTGLTVGTLDVVRRNLVGVMGGRERAFNDQCVVKRLPGATKPMSDPGDSGAMVFDKASRRAAGLVIGAPIGDNNDEESIVSPISTIMKDLEIELL